MKYIWLILPLSLLISCASTNKEAFMSDLDRFVDEVDRKHESYTEEDWERKNKEFERLMESDYNEEIGEELTTEEKVHVAQQVMKYTSQQISDRITEHVDKNSDEYAEIVDESAKLFETLGDEFTREVLPELEAIGPELKEITEEFVSRLKDSGAFDRIKDAFLKWGKELERIGEDMENVDINIDTDEDGNIRIEENKKSKNFEKDAKEMEEEEEILL
ncbi:MAG: DUF6565 domain-containing protein [Bacteroidota bacterium]